MVSKSTATRSSPCEEFYAELWRSASQEPIQDFNHNAGIELNERTRLSEHFGFQSFVNAAFKWIKRTQEPYNQAPVASEINETPVLLQIDCSEVPGFYDHAFCLMAICWVNNWKNPSLNF